MNGAARLLDVNVPMYAAGQAHPYKEACVWIMTEVAKGRLDAAIDTETIQEVLYRYGALRKWDLAVSVATELLIVVPTVHPVLLADARLAVDLFRQTAPRVVPARDLIHVAVMRNNGINEIISADEHFDRVDGITRLDPRRLFDQFTRR